MAQYYLTYAYRWINNIVIMLIGDSIL